MDRQNQRTRNDFNSGRVWAGIIIVGIGAVLLAGKLGLGWLFPHWLFNWHNLWPVMFILIGLIIGGNSNFRNPAALFFFIFGGFFLLKNVFDFNLGPFIWPVIIIGIGLWLLLGNNRSGRYTPGPRHRGYRYRHPRNFEWDKRVTDDGTDAGDETGNHPDTGNYQQAYDEKGGPDPDGANEFNAYTADDYVKSTAVFSDVKKTVISKRFQGGEVVNIFGGTDINLIQAEIHHPIVIDVFQLFAGMKIIVPSHWKVQSEVVSIFGEVDDKRFIQGIPQDEQKVVYIKGTSIFGGITIKNI